MLNEHRKAVGEEISIYSLKPPFSFFDFVESHFGNVDSIRRIFSLARASDARTLIYEKIIPKGIIAEENEDIVKLFSDYHNQGLIRISLWNKDVEDLTDLNNKNLIGYTIIKHDVSKEADCDRWHIFEAVFVKYPHDHNCVPCPKTYNLTVGKRSFSIQGLLYCQQNSLNKSCAQVALRSLLSRYLPDGDISYRKINQIAGSVVDDFNPAKGLSVLQIRKIFNNLGIKYNDIDYTEIDEKNREELPYQKYAYAGMEAGEGALIGFRLTGRKLREEAKHIIPIYGHTFNKDTWAPDADVAYFKIGEELGYVPSESWTSSFLGHDDNFGPNFCIPRLYIGNDKVDYVVEIFKPGVHFSGVQAEALALNILYSLLPNLNEVDNRWISRLIDWTNVQRIVFRAMALSGPAYIKHLREISDWEGNHENNDVCDELESEMPKMVWAVEISTPQLFPANERKLGDIVFDATRRLDTEMDFMMNEVFLFARLPGIYLFGGNIKNNNPHFTIIQSEIVSHTDLIRLI